MSSAAARSPAGHGRRLVLVLPQLALGGAQRIAALMAAYWAERGHDVYVLTWLPARDFFVLHPRVRRIRLSAPDGWRTCLCRLPRRRQSGSQSSGTASRIRSRAAYARLFALRNAAVGFLLRNRLPGSASAYVFLLRIGYWPARMLRRELTRIDPDVVVSLLGTANVLTIAASANLRHRIVVSEWCDPVKEPLDAVTSAFGQILYPAAHVVAANSHGALASMRADCPTATLRFLPNPLVLPERSRDAARRDAVLFLGRLSLEKGPDVLVEAFAQFARAAPGWRLDVAGDGRMASSLRRRVEALGLAGAVTFHGAVTDPGPLLAADRIFVLPSRREGTPSALLEAMAHGMACVVSDASPGPLHLIVHGVTGLVVRTGVVAGLAEALARLAQDAALRARLGAAAYDRVREFGIDRVGPVWDRIVFPEDGRP